MVDVWGGEGNRDIKDESQTAGQKVVPFAEMGTPEKAPHRRTGPGL